MCVGDRPFYVELIAYHGGLPVERMIVLIKGARVSTFIGEGVDTISVASGVESTLPMSETPSQSRRIRPNKEVTNHDLDL